MRGLTAALGIITRVTRTFKKNYLDSKFTELLLSITIIIIIIFLSTSLNDLSSLQIQTFLDRGHSFSRITHASFTRESDLGERTRVEAIGGAISRTGRGRPRRKREGGRRRRRRRARLK